MTGRPCPLVAIIEGRNAPFMPTEELFQCYSRPSSTQKPKFSIELNERYVLHCTFLGNSVAALNFLCNKLSSNDAIFDCSLFCYEGAVPQPVGQWDWTQHPLLHPFRVPQHSKGYEVSCPSILTNFRNRRGLLFYWDFRLPRCWLCSQNLKDIFKTFKTF